MQRRLNGNTRRSNRSERLPFLVAVALIAAAIGDVLVETISNTGVIGRGYSDDNHLSVIPTLIAGGACALLLVCGRCFALLRAPTEHRRWLAGMAAQISDRSSMQDLPLVLVLQFVALFVMESVEQLCFGGKLLGGTLWLGGPIWFSVLAHVLLGASCMFLLRRAIRAIVGRCAVLVGIAHEFMCDAFARGASSRFARHAWSYVFCIQSVRVYQTGERAPPLLLTII